EQALPALEDLVLATLRVELEDLAERRRRHIVEGTRRHLDDAIDDETLGPTARNEARVRFEQRRVRRHLGDIEVARAGLSTGESGADQLDGGIRRRRRVLALELPEGLFVRLEAKRLDQCRRRLGDGVNAAERADVDQPERLGSKALREARARQVR